MPGCCLGTDLASTQPQSVATCVAAAIFAAVATDAAPVQSSVQSVSLSCQVETAFWAAVCSLEMLLMLLLCVSASCMGLSKQDCAG